MSSGSREEHHAVVSSPVRLAVRAQNTFPLKAGLLDGADRRLVVRRSLGEDPAEAKLAEAPGRPESERLRCDTASSCFREHGDGEPGSLLVVPELDVEEAERPVVGRVCDHERRSRARAPLLLDPRHALALSIPCERFIVQSAPRLGVVGRLRDERHVFGSPHSEDDLSFAERPVGRNESTSCQVRDASSVQDVEIGRHGPP
jgi:hypothetical protein